MTTKYRLIVDIDWMNLSANTSILIHDEKDMDRSTTNFINHLENKYPDHEFAVIDWPKDPFLPSHSKYVN